MRMIPVIAYSYIDLDQADLSWCRAASGRNYRLWQISEVAGSAREGLFIGENRPCA
jgi:hypothetical protein